MNNVNNNEGVEQATKALSALEWPRRQTDQRLKEEEELALKQMISGITPEWNSTGNKKKKGVITLLRIWMGEMMNCAIIQMNSWIAKKNEQKDKVQKRWDNKGKINKAFQRWRAKIKHEKEEQVDGKEEGDRRLEKEKTYGIKNWGKVRTIPRIHKQVKNFLQTGIG
eukprot:5545712-Pleurochrysis_carterae.AAC.1